MLKIKNIIIATLTLLLTTTSCFALEDAIIAIVNDEIITLKDLKDYVHSTYVSLVAEGVGDEEIKSIMIELEINGVNKLIEDKLILSKANTIGLEVRDASIDERVEKIKKKYPSENAFIEALVKNGATISDLKNKVKNQMKIQFVIDHEVRSKVFVNPKEVTNYYKKNNKQFMEQEQMKLESIFIAFEENKIKAMKKANQALEAIKSGTEFTEVAQEFSDAPSIGLVQRGQLQEKIENTIFKLNIGEISPLVETDLGVYIFKCQDYIPAQISALEDIKESVQTFLFREKFKEKFTAWLAKLKKEAYIEIKK